MKGTIVLRKVEEPVVGKEVILYYSRHKITSISERGVKLGTFSRDWGFDRIKELGVEVDVLEHPIGIQIPIQKKTVFLPMCFKDYDYALEHVGEEVTICMGMRWFAPEGKIEEYAYIIK